MPAFNKNANGGASVPLNLAPRGKRSGSGQVDTLWRGSLPAVVATGGTVTDIVVNGVPYKLHTFTSSQPFIVISGGNVEYMMVGGGSSTGSTQNGGGAGQVTNGIVAAPVGSNSIGVGGAAAPSTALGITAASGSGSTSGNGYVTGANYGGTFQNFCLGGGGGATANGGNASNSAGGAGGAGRDISAWLGQSPGTTYKGGGGGGAGYGNIDWATPPQEHRQAVLVVEEVAAIAATATTAKPIVVVALAPVVVCRVIHLTPARGVPADLESSTFAIHVTSGCDASSCTSNSSVSVSPSR